MKTWKRNLIFGILFTLTAGSLAHFFYEWSGNNHFVGLFTPVNESVWEHMKLVFFPMLLYSVFFCLKNKKDIPCIGPALCFGILLGTSLIPVLFFTYVKAIGRDIFILDLATFAISILAAYAAVYKLGPSCKLKPYGSLLCVLVGIYAACFFWFTYHPPEGLLFAEPTSAFFYGR